MRWSYISNPQNIDVSETIPIEIQVPEIKGFQLACDEPERVMDSTRVIEFKIKVKKEKDIENLPVNISVLSPPGKKNKFRVYLRELSQSDTPTANKLTLQLQESSPKTFIAGIVASKAIPGTSSTLTIKATGVIRKQKIEKMYPLKFILDSEFADTTDIRREYEFSMKRDKIFLPITRGEPATSSITIENHGKKSDTIKITMTRTIPMGWWARPHHFKVKVNPDEKDSITMEIFAPLNASIGEIGILSIKGESRGNPAVIQIKQVIAKVE